MLETASSSALVLGLNVGMLLCFLSDNNYTALSLVVQCIVIGPVCLCVCLCVCLFVGLLPR